MENSEKKAAGSIIYSKCEEKGKIYAAYYSTDAEKVIEFVKGTNIITDSKKKELIDEYTEKINKKGNYVVSLEFSVGTEEAFKSRDFEKTFGKRVELPSCRHESEFYDELGNYFSQLSEDMRKKKDSEKRGTSLFHMPRGNISLENFFSNLKKYEVTDGNDDIRAFTEADKRMKRSDYLPRHIQKALETANMIDNNKGQLELKDYQRTATRLMRLDSLLDLCKNTSGDKSSSEFIYDSRYQKDLLRYFRVKNPLEDQRKQNAHMN